jgi:hypothetical protein
MSLRNRLQSRGPLDSGKGQSLLFNAIAKFSAQALARHEVDADVKKIL